MEEKIEDEIIEGRKLSRDEALELCGKLELDRLCEAADRVRRRFLGTEVDTCAIMNARSGACSEDCKWCAQSARHNTGCAVYGCVSPAEALRHARRARESGIKRFSLVTSGRSLSDADFNAVLEALCEISKLGGISICASLGLLDESRLGRLKNAGVERYHCNLETAPSKFPELCTTHTVADKITVLSAARRVGLSVCSGGIIGMGETRAQRVELACALVDIGADSIPVNILQPIKGTPLENLEPLTKDEILRTFAVFRLVNPRAHIRFAGGRAAIASAQETALRSGVSALIVGDMLTTAGARVADDFKMLERLGYDFR